MAKLLLPIKVFARCFTRPPDNLGTPHLLHDARSNPIAPERTRATTALIAARAHVTLAAATPDPAPTRSPSDAPPRCLDPLYTRARRRAAPTNHMTQKRPPNHPFRYKTRESQAATAVRLPARRGVGVSIAFGIGFDQSGANRTSASAITISATYQPFCCIKSWNGRRQTGRTEMTTSPVVVANTYCQMSSAATGKCVSLTIRIGFQYAPDEDTPVHASSRTLTCALSCGPAWRSPSCRCQSVPGAAGTRVQSRTLAILGSLEQNRRQTTLDNGDDP